MVTEAATRTVAVTNRHGLHVRPCLAIVNTVKRHNAEVTVHKNGQTANGSSILELMSLAAPQGTQLVLSARGQNAQEALDALARLFANEFEILYKE